MVHVMKLRRPDVISPGRVGGHPHGLLFAVAQLGDIVCTPQDDTLRVGHLHGIIILAIFEYSVGIATLL